MNNQTSSQEGTTYQTPEINPYQIIQNRNAAGFTQNTLYPNAAAAAQGVGEAYAAGKPGINQAANSAASYANTGGTALGTAGMNNLAVGSEGLQSLFSPEYQQQQINAAMLPGQEQYNTNMAAQGAQFGGAGQLGSARQALAGNQLAQQSAMNQQQVAAGVNNQIAQQRANAANSLMSGGAGQIVSGAGVNAGGMTAAMAPMQLASQYASAINGMNNLGRGDFVGTNGMITASGVNKSQAAAGTNLF